MSLQRNIWILYPAGWAGNYLSWILQKSTPSMTGVVDNPIGANGTSHSHSRSPTHQGLFHHIAWRNSNNITDNRIYLTNVDSLSKSLHVRPAWVAHYIMRYDPSALIINIHDNHDETIWQFGSINGWTKWPVQYTSRAVWEPDAYCPVTDSDQARAAKWLSKNWRTYCPRNTPIDTEELRFNFDGQKRWLDVRHDFCPEDIPREQYHFPTNYQDNIVEVNLRDIFDADFVPSFLDQLQPHFSELFDAQHCNRYHALYLNNQPNLRWFQDWQRFIDTGQPSDWLTNLTITNGFVLERLGI